MAELDRKIAALVAAIEAGADALQITEQLKRRSVERAGLAAKLQLEVAEKRMTASEIDEALAQLGGMTTLLAHADGETRHTIYASLGLRLTYDPDIQRVTATAEQACVFNRVRRGT